jgi:hypothetical protein
MFDCGAGTCAFNLKIYRTNTRVWYSPNLNLCRQIFSRRDTGTSENISSWFVMKLTVKGFSNVYIKAVLRISIRMEPHHFGKLDLDLRPDPHQSEKQYPDQHQVDVDPQHCIKDKPRVSEPTS